MRLRALAYMRGVFASALTYMHGCMPCEEEDTCVCERVNIHAWHPCIHDLLRSYNMYVSSSSYDMHVSFSSYGMHVSSSSLPSGN